MALPVHGQFKLCGVKMLHYLHPRNIANLPRPERGQIDYFDSNQPGFGIRVAAGGVRSWFVMYRLSGRKERKRRYTYGRFPEMSLATARLEARMILAEVRLGKDPQ